MIKLYHEVKSVEIAINEIAELIELDTEIEIEEMAWEITDEEKTDA